MKKMLVVVVVVAGYALFEAALLLSVIVPQPLIPLEATRRPYYGGKSCLFPAWRLCVHASYMVRTSGDAGR
jgi:hypothetical protein